MLLVEALLDRERYPQADPPGADGPVLDHRGDAGDLGLADAVDGGRGAVHGEPDRILDRVGGGAGERDRLLDHRGLLPRAADAPPFTIGVVCAGDASYGAAWRAIGASPASSRQATPRWRGRTWSSPRESSLDDRPYPRPSRANSAASVGNASGGGAAGSNQSAATASSPATGRAAGSTSLAANQTRMVGFSGSWKFDATWTTSPITTSTPASSRASRAAAARTSSPHTANTHGNHHRPAPNCPGARRTRSTRPAASRMTHAAPTPGLAKKTKPQRGQLGRGMPPRTTRTSAVRHRGHATQSSPGRGIGPARMADRDGPVQGRRPFTAGRRRARDAPSARRSTMRPYAYDRLSFLDNSFLITESPTNHMHVAGTASYEAGPLRRPDGGIDIDRIRDYVASRLHLIPRYRQVLAWTPIEGHPVWVDDAHFNIDYHVRHTSLPRPGDAQQLKRLSGRIMSQQLDRSKPLWEMWIVEGLEGGERFAVITKVHHCMIDGMSSVDLLEVLLKSQPTDTIEPGPRWIPRPAPRPRDLLWAEAVRRASMPFDLVRGFRRFLAEAEDPRSDLRAMLRAVRDTVRSTLRQVSDTPPNKPVVPHGRFDWLAMDLAEA